jgi:hypothetical protein
VGARRCFLAAFLEELDGVRVARDLFGGLAVHVVEGEAVAVFAARENLVRGDSATKVKSDSASALPRMIGPSRVFITTSTLIDPIGSNLADHVERTAKILISE